MRRNAEISNYYHHHTSMKVSNVTKSQLFFSLFGFEEAARRFRAGSARAMWLRAASHVPDASPRLELVEIPTDMPSKRLDLSSPENTGMTGLNHITIDVTARSKTVGGLSQMLIRLNEDSELRFNQSIHLLVPPYQQIIGQDVVELAFIQGPDGIQVELVTFVRTLLQSMEPAW
eukprot:CAMPEP_0171595160 /NCGR_PEP_ID=MMETSP0990-20121206/1158_1 /TAXON_ID=483369 /ORGANISM="non described non described, Strain CCMP2098" /LENGTH=173 /DNA_ID=CAMNT_0012156065 /DNA_START=177 /DNA_END=698 /DNA_ORIENTATION=-